MALPFFEALLLRDGFGGGGERLHANQPEQTMLPDEFAAEAAAVQGDARREVVGDAGVERAVFAVGEDVDVEHGRCREEGPYSAACGPGSETGGSPPSLRRPGSPQGCPGPNSLSATLLREVRRVGTGSSLRSSGATEKVTASVVKPIHMQLISERIHDEALPSRRIEHLHRRFDGAIGSQPR